MQWISICRDVLSFGVSSLTAQEFTSLGAGLRTASWQQRVPKIEVMVCRSPVCFRGFARKTHMYTFCTHGCFCVFMQTQVCIYILYMYVNIYYLYTCIHICYILYIYIYCLFVCLFIYCLQIDMICLCKL